MSEPKIPDDAWAQWCRDVEAFLAWCDTDDLDPASHPHTVTRQGEKP